MMTNRMTYDLVVKVFRQFATDASSSPATFIIFIRLLTFFYP